MFDIPINSLKTTQGGTDLETLLRLGGKTIYNPEPPKFSRR